MVQLFWHVVLISAVFGCVQAQRINQGRVPSCEGVFDFYFVLDSSRSIRGNFHSGVVPFVQNVSRNFVSPDFRLCFITFATESVLQMPLTRIGDSEAIDDGIQNLSKVSPGGHTYLSRGLKLALEQIHSAGGDTAAVVLVLTDGEFRDLDPSLTQANRLRKRGARVFGIGIGEDVDEQQLLSVADEADQVFNESNFQQLDQIIEKVINKTCIEIRKVIKQDCTESSDSLTLLGRGFTNDLNQSRVTCRFQPVDGHAVVTYPIEPVKYDQIICPAPELNRTGEVLLQISLNGISFISSNVTLDLSTCESENKSENNAYVAGIVLGLLALVCLLLLLLLLWCCFPLITGTAIGGVSPEPEKKTVGGVSPEPEKTTVGAVSPEPEKREPETKPPRKWEVVDASYYGGGGAGGIKPVTVRWGKSGATEGGNKLTKAKDANVVHVSVVKEPGTVREPGTPKGRHHTLGCWTLLKRKAKRAYAILASYRPVRGTTRHIVWCPGRKGNYTLYSRHSTGRSSATFESPNAGTSGSLKSQTNEVPCALPKSMSSKQCTEHRRPQQQVSQNHVPHKPTPPRPPRPAPPRPAPPRPAPPRPSTIEATNPCAL